VYKLRGKALTLTIPVPLSQTRGWMSSPSSARGGLRRGRGASAREEEGVGASARPKLAQAEGEKFSLFL
jgi:hypothetical protein